MLCGCAVKAGMVCVGWQIKLCGPLAYTGHKFERFRDVFIIWR